MHACIVISPDGETRNYQIPNDDLILEYQNQSNTLQWLSQANALNAPLQSREMLFMPFKITYWSSRGTLLALSNPWKNATFLSKGHISYNLIGRVIFGVPRT